MKIDMKKQNRTPSYKAHPVTAERNFWDDENAKFNGYENADTHFKATQEHLHDHMEDALSHIDGGGVVTNNYGPVTIAYMKHPETGHYIIQAEDHEHLHNEVHKDPARFTPEDVDINSYDPQINTPNRDMLATDLLSHMAEYAGEQGAPLFNKISVDDYHSAIDMMYSDEDDAYNKGHSIFRGGN